MIRNTWGKNRRVFCMLGHDPLMKNSLIDEERAQCNDIVQGSFLDTYRNMTYKHVMALHWAHTYCLNASVIVQTDDDVHVNLELIRKPVDKVYNQSMSSSNSEPSCNTSIIMCDISNYGPVFREDGHKWKVTKEEYEPDLYPLYCSGWHIIYTRAAIRCLLEQVSNVRYLWVDDVYVTGLLVRAAGLRLIQNDYQVIWRKKDFSPVMSNHSTLENFANNVMVGPFDISLSDMEYLWNVINVYKLQP